MKNLRFSVKHVVLAAALTLALVSALLASSLTTAASAASTSARAAATVVAPKLTPAKATSARSASAARLGKIALMTSVGGDILLLDPVTGKLERLTNGIDPAFSPDGTKLAFTRWEPQAGVFVRDLKTGEERKVVGTEKPRHPSWSSDGQKLAFVRLVRVVKCRESVLGCLPEAQLAALFGGQDCAPTPAGNLCISEMPFRDIDETGIVEVSLDGSGWQDVPAASDAQSVSWRPNSQDLLHRGNNRLQITAPGRTPYEIVRDQWFGSPSWSPDGTKFVAQKRIHDHTDLALFDASGTLIKYLTKPPSALRRSPHNVAPAWSADGKTILFLTDREATSVWKLYRMNADGSGQAPFLPNALKNIIFRYDFAAERVASWGR